VLSPIPRFSAPLQSAGIGLSTDNLQLTTALLATDSLQLTTASVRHPTLLHPDFLKLLPAPSDPNFIMARLTQQ
jgi:hypothetical protein